MVAAILWLPLGSAERVELDGLLASESMGWLRCGPLQLMLAGVLVEISCRGWTGATRKCLLLWLLRLVEPFICPALNAAQKFHSLLFESLYLLGSPPQMSGSCRRLFLLSPALA